ncbi:hypothetical protein ABZ477_17455 [Microbacterium sp. NPDC019599]|uniref:hypothetical protein n=1 Tax=Microbacterium sp. NPDC019599 TaxID=3154690 RepID=UPI0034068B80
MRTSAWVTIAGIAAVVVGAGAILVGIAASQPQPVTEFPPWYPARNSEGDAASADFEAHVPCSLDPVPDPACQRIKLGLVLYRDPVTDEPTTYVMSIIRVGVGDEREVRQGDVGIGSGTALDADDVVYRLTGVPDHLRTFWAVGDDLLLLLDEDGMPRVGDAGYSFTLNRVPLREG